MGTMKKVLAPIISSHGLGSPYFGEGTISGSVTVIGSPGKKRLTLFDKNTMKFIRQTYSDKFTGAYAFPYLSPSYTYFVVAWDDSHAYNAEIADNLVPA